MLDGEIGNAAPRIEPVGRRKGGGRARILARRTATAAVAPGRRRRKIERRIDRAQEQPAAMLAADEITVLALPAESRRRRQRLFHHRRGIDEHLDLGLGSFGDQPARDRLQRLFDDVMIVGALRIDRNTAPARMPRKRERVERRGIAHAERDHRLDLGPQSLGRPPLSGAAFHPDHAAVAPFGEPLLQACRRLRCRIGTRDPEGGKTLRARRRLQAVFEGRQGFGNHWRSIRGQEKRAIACSLTPASPSEDEGAVRAKREPHRCRPRLRSAEPSSSLGETV